VSFFEHISDRYKDLNLSLPADLFRSNARLFFNNIHNNDAPMVLGSYGYALKTKKIGKAFFE